VTQVTQVTHKCGGCRIRELSVVEKSEDAKSDADNDHRETEQILRH